MSRTGVAHRLGRVGNDDADSADPLRHGQQHLIAHDRESPMFRFTIRDVLWLTVVVAGAGQGEGVAFLTLARDDAGRR